MSQKRDMVAKGRPNNRLRIARRRRGWTQDAVVERMSNTAGAGGLPPLKGLNANYVSRWERGIVQPDPYHSLLLCLAFELPPDRLGLPDDSSSTDGDVKCRDFLRALGGAAMTIAVDV